MGQPLESGTARVPGAAAASCPRSHQYDARVSSSPTLSTHPMGTRTHTPGAPAWSRLRGYKKVACIYPRESERGQESTERTVLRAGRAPGGGCGQGEPRELGKWGLAGAWEGRGHSCQASPLCRSPSVLLRL